MRMAAASLCLRLALRLDPDIPLRHLAAARDVNLERGINNTWVVLSVFDEYRHALDFVSWAQQLPRRLHPSEKDTP